MKFNEQIDLDNINLPQDPIFIVGSPRSGTTLLQSLLATQRNIYSFPETHFFSIIIRSIKEDQDGNIESSCLVHVFKEIGRMMGLEFSQPTVDTITAMAKAKKLTLKNLFEIVVFPYLYEQVKEYDLKNIRWIEKTPSHFHALHKISSLYPSAQFVCIIRNPIYVIHSRKKNIPQEQNVPVKILAHEWNKMLFLIDDFRRQNPKAIYLLRYEDLVENLEAEMSALCTYLNVEMISGLLEGYKDVSHKFVLPWETWKAAVRSNAISNTNASYKSQIKRIDTLKIQHITQENMKKYEYDISYIIVQDIYDILSSLFYWLNKGHTKILTHLFE